MRKFILPVLLCFIFINPATANDEIKSLLKTLDKALKYKLDYAEQKYPFRKEHCPQSDNPLISD